MTGKSRFLPFTQVFVGLSLALGMVQLSYAAPDATVEAVQMPAWVERGSARLPLAPGMELQNGDDIRTGANSRLLLKTADGSSVKLGENAKLKLSDMVQQKDGVFVAALDVGEGAFRFTTDIFKKLRGKRLVNIRVANVTAGVRGTDLWGKSATDKQIVCLIEGRIDVTPPDEQPIVMDQALQFFIRENGKSLPVGMVDPKQLAQWATETEAAGGAGAALKVYDDVRNAGYAATIQPLREGDKRSYNIRIAKLPSKDEAQALAASLKGKLGVADPRVSM